MMARIVRCFGDSVKDEERGDSSYSTDRVHALMIDDRMTVTTTSLLCSKLWDSTAKSFCSVAVASKFKK
jgi:hypothetical protein